MQPTTPAEQLAGLDHVLDTMRKRIEAYKACTDETFILAWDNGLGVNFIGPDQRAVVDLLNASKVPSLKDASTPVTNGHGERAKLIMRRVACATYVPHLEQSVALIQGARDQLAAQIEA